MCGTATVATGLARSTSRKCGARLAGIPLVSCEHADLDVVVERRLGQVRGGDEGDLARRRRPPWRGDTPAGRRARATAGRRTPPAPSIPANRGPRAARRSGGQARRAESCRPARWMLRRSVDLQLGAAPFGQRGLECLRPVVVRVRADPKRCSADPTSSSYTRRVSRACRPGTSGPDQTRSGCGTAATARAAVRVPRRRQVRGIPSRSAAAERHGRCGCLRPPPRAARTAAPDMARRAARLERPASRSRRCAGSSSNGSIMGRAGEECGVAGPRASARRARGRGSRCASRTRSRRPARSRGRRRRGASAPPCSRPAHAGRRSDRWSTAAHPQRLREVILDVPRLLDQAAERALGVGARGVQQDPETVRLRST